MEYQKIIHLLDNTSDFLLYFTLLLFLEPRFITKNG